MGMSTQGLFSALRGLKGLADLSDNVVDDTLEEIAFRILKKAKEKTPVDTGFLRSSGQVEEIDGGFRVAFKAKYALPVHERTEVSHANGEAKFLKNAAEVILSQEQVGDLLFGRILDQIA
jgi:hypothetical protein